MPIPFKTACELTMTVTEVNLYSQAEIMKLWSDYYDKKISIPADKCHVIKGISLKTALIITGLWLREVSDSLENTYFDPKNGMLVLSLHSAVLEQEKKDKERVNIVLANLMRETRNVISYVLGVENHFTITKDRKGLKLFYDMGSY